MEENICVTSVYESVYSVNLSEYLQYTKKKKCSLDKLIAKKQIYLGTAHKLNLRPYTMRAGFDPKTIHVVFVLEIVALGWDRIREIRLPL
jgi:hypothetical protein